MEEIFSHIFDEALNKKHSELLELSEKKVLINPYSQQEYHLTHRYSFSLNTFLCIDQSKNEHHLKVLPCGSFSKVQQGSRSLLQIQGKCQSNALLETFDSFEVLDRGRWFLVVVTPSLVCVSLKQLRKASEKIKEMMPRHHFISILLAMIEIIEDVHARSTQIGCIFPNTVLVCRQKVGPHLFDVKGTAYSLKVSPVSQAVLLKKEKKLDFKKSDLWAVFLTFKSIAEKSEERVSNGLTLKMPELVYPDPALEKVVFLLFSEDPSVFKDRTLMLWKGCFKGQYEIIEKSTVQDLQVLHSVLLFTDYRMKSMVLQQLLILSKTEHEVYLYLNDNNLFWLFIEECLQISWENQKGLLEAFFKILKQKPKDHIFKEKLGELGILGLVYTTTLIDPHNESFLDFILDFMCENTLTVMQILYDTDVLAKTLECCRKSPYLKGFIKDTMSNYGTNSLKLIEEIYSLELFQPTHIIQSLIDVPYYFKIDKMEQLLTLLVQILKRKKCPKDEFADMIKYTVQLVTELLTLPYMVQSNHLKCSCSSHLNNDLFYLTKNPFLYYCEDCSEPLCSACLKYSFHKGHRYFSLLYITPHFRCNCTENHTFPNSTLPDLTFSKLPPRFSFLPTPGTIEPEAHFNRFSGKTQMVITTCEPIVKDWNSSSPGIIGYYEVKVNKAGNQEDISLGFLGADIVYHCKNGRIEVGGNLAFQAPRVGSYDTIGLGLLKTQQAFFTYNGLLSSHLIDVEVSREIKIHITINGIGWEIEVKLRSFLFQSFKPDFESLKSKPKEIFEEIFKILQKSCKKGQDMKMTETRKNFANLLRSIGKEKLAKKLY